MDEIDDDGRPTTIRAARQMFHKNQNHLYFPSQNFHSVEEATEKLDEGKMRIRQLIS